MNKEHLKQALQEALGTKVFDDNMAKSLDKSVDQIRKSGQKGEDESQLSALRATLGSAFSHNVERQVLNRVKVLSDAGGNPPPGPGMGGTNPPEEKVATPFNDPLVKGTPEQDAVTSHSLKGDVVGDINAEQKAAFEHDPDAATRGSGGNTPAGGLNSRVAAATNSGSTGSAGPGAGNVSNR